MENYVGRKFGKLLVIKGTELNTSRNRPNEYKKYQCLCECGNNFEILTSQLNKGTQSCGCLKVLSNLTDKLKTGMRFGRLTVVGYNTDKKRWEYICDCGNSYFSSARRVLSGNTKSCGCLNRDKNREKAIKLINQRSHPNPKEYVAECIYDNYHDGELSFEQFMELSQSNCFYCGLSSQNSNSQTKYPSQYSYLAELSDEERTFRYNGLDRINNTIPHNYDNCVPSCWLCNRAKRRIDKNIFIEKIKKLGTFENNLSYEEYNLLAIDIDVSFFDIKEKFSLAKSVRSRYKSYCDGDLELKQFYQLTQLPCYYCGTELSNLTNRAKNIKKSSQFAKDTGDYRYNGLDQINSKKGHFFNNIIPCCNFCNYSKKDMPIEEFLKWKERLRIKYKE